MKQFLVYIDNFLGKIFEKFQKSSSLPINNHSLGYFRFLLGVSYLTFVTPHWGWLTQVPDAFYSPHLLNFTNLFDSFPPNSLLKFFDVLIVVLLLFITLGIKTRLSSFTAFFVLLIMNGFAYSLGKVDHPILFTFCLLTMSFSNVGSYNALLKDSPVSAKTHHFSTSLFAILICFGFVTASSGKIVKWIDFDLTTSGILGWFYPGYYALGRQRFLASFFPMLPALAIEVLDYLAAFFELSGFLWLYLGKRSWLTWLTVACSFHLINLLVLNISFYPHIFVYGLFILPHFFEILLENKQVQKFKQIIKISKLWLIIPIALVVNALIGRIWLNQRTMITLSLHTKELIIAISWFSIFICGIFTLIKKDFSQE